MMKRLLHSVFILGALLAFVEPSLALAQAPSDLQSKIEETTRQRDALLIEQKNLQAALDTLNKSGQTLQTTVKTLDATKKKLANDLKITQTNISSANLTISKLSSDINKNQLAIDNNKAAIVASIRKLASYDSRTLVYNLLAYQSLNTVWNDAANLMDTENALGDEINALKIAQQQLTQNKTAKEEQKTKLVSLSHQLSGQKQVVEQTQTTKQQLLTETRSQEVKFEQMLAENIAKEKDFENQLFQYESQLKATNPSETPQARKGVIGWPLDVVVVTQQFGKTSSSGRLYSSGTHNGVDFRASVGTPVKSVRGGIVEGMGNTDDQRGCYSYGRWVLIKHDNGLSSLYAHLSATIVAQGQALSTGQIIGYSGGAPRAYGSGYSTGPHLHIGLFVAAAVQVSQYSASQNCKNVSIPLANPQDYLDPLAYLPSL